MRVPVKMGSTFERGTPEKVFDAPSLAVHPEAGLGRTGVMCRPTVAVSDNQGDQWGRRAPTVAADRSCAELVRGAEAPRAAEVIAASCTHDPARSVTMPPNSSCWQPEHSLPLWSATCRTSPDQCQCDPNHHSGMRSYLHLAHNTPERASFDGYGIVSSDGSTIRDVVTLKATDADASTVTRIYHRVAGGCGRFDAQQGHKPIGGPLMHAPSQGQGVEQSRRRRVMLTARRPKVSYRLQ